MVERTFNKIFCIGFNRTGTQSLHQALKNLGLNSLHHGIKIGHLDQRLDNAQQISALMKHAIENDDDNPLGTGLRFDVFLDIGAIIEYYQIFDKKYPGSKFIYTTRDYDSWIKSRCNHILKEQQNVLLGLQSTIFVTGTISKWIYQRVKHEAYMIEYFEDRPNDLLEINICSRGEGYEKLCPFLNLPMRNENFPFTGRSKVK